MYSVATSDLAVVAELAQLPLGALAEDRSGEHLGHELRQREEAGLRGLTVERFQASIAAAQVLLAVADDCARRESPRRHCRALR